MLRNIFINTSKLKMAITMAASEYVCDMMMKTAKQENNYKEGRQNARESTALAQERTHKELANELEGKKK